MQSLYHLEAAHRAGSPKFFNPDNLTIYKSYHRTVISNDFCSYFHNNLFLNYITSIPARIRFVKRKLAPIRRQST